MNKIFKIDTDLRQRTRFLHQSLEVTPRTYNCNN